MELLFDAISDLLKLSCVLFIGYYITGKFTTIETEAGTKFSSHEQKTFLNPFESNSSLTWYQ